MPTPEEIAAAEAAKAKEAEDAKVAAEAKAKAEQEEAAKKALEDEAYDKDRAMATITKLREQEKALKARAKKADELEALEKQRADAELTESERLKKEKAELEEENKTIKSNLMRQEVIAETGLPAIFADRLKGETKEEMLADAEALAKTLPQLKVAPKLPPTNPSQGSPNETDAQKRSRLFGEQRNVFDMESIKAAGGGVFFDGDLKVGKN